MDISPQHVTQPTRAARISARVQLVPILWVALATFCVAFVVRLYRLGAQSLWLDEGGTWVEVTRQSWAHLLADMFRPTAAYPLYHLLLKAWVAIAGDSEWALRFPSAFASAATVAILVLAISQITEHRRAVVLAALAAIVSPYALWHAQDAKAYSLLMLVVALMLWAALRALRFETRRAWFVVAGLACVSVFVHRLALLPIAALLLGVSWARLQGPKKQSVWFLHPAVLAALGLASGALGVIGLARSINSNGWQESGHSAASPLESLWLNLSHFILDRGDIGGFLNMPLLAWALPGLLLTIWGLVLLARDAWRGQQAARVVLSAFALPVLLFALVLAFTPVYESRYAAVAFPPWLLVIAWPLGEAKVSRAMLSFAASGLVLLSVGVSAAVLFQPEHGQFSGAPVKEQWREGIKAIAAEAHPDDLIVLHPYYTMPLWEYYVPRVTPDPVPQPVVFSDFGEGNCVEVYRGNPQAIRACYQRTYDDRFNQVAFGKKRALLLIAPEHAATIDPPKTLVDLQKDYAAGLWGKNADPPTKPDVYGWVGLRFLIPQKSWPCGGSGNRFIGVETMCQSYPEVYSAGRPSNPPNPAIPLEATFGGELKLRGYSLDMFGGKARPGGSLPITLYWQSLKNPTRDYRMFVHLCKDCESPPLAQNDQQPLYGYPKAGLTTTWRGYPVHDERSLPLPSSLAPGRYTLLLGVYPVDNPTQEARLPVTNAQGQVLGGTRLILGTVEVTR